MSSAVSVRVRTECINRARYADGLLHLWWRDQVALQKVMEEAPDRVRLVLCGNAGLRGETTDGEEKALRKLEAAHSECSAVLVDKVLNRRYLRWCV